MTVSRALRNATEINAATRDKVLAAAKELGYRPNPLVQTFMAGVRRRRVGHQANLAWVTSGDHGHPTRQRLRRGAAERANEMGFGFDEVRLASGESSARELTRVLAARGIVGAVIAPLKEFGTINFPWERFPVATIGRSLAEPTTHYVMAHFYHMMSRALAELGERGYRRPGFLNTREMDLRFDHAPLLSFQLTMADGEAATPKRPAVFCDGWKTADYRNWLKETRPDAVVAVLPSIYKKLLEAKAKIPDKIGFVTLSWTETQPECTGILHPWEAIGAGAVDLVIAQLHRNERGIPPRPKAILFEGDWKEGRTLPSRI